MRDRCLIETPSAEVVTDENGVVTATQTRLYAGKCRLRTRSAVVATENAAQHTFSMEDVELQLPITTPEPPVGATVTMTGSESNPQLVGNVYNVTGTGLQSQPTKLVVHVERLQA